MSDRHFSFKIPFTKNKFFESEICTELDSDLSFLWVFKTKGDHPGLRVYCTVHKTTFGFSFYDNRHWDWETDSFAKEGD